MKEVEFIQGPATDGVQNRATEPTELALRHLLTALQKHDAAWNVVQDFPEFGAACRALVHADTVGSALLAKAGGSMNQASPDPLRSELLEFVRDIAKRDLVFAKGPAKKTITGARAEGGK